MVSGVNVSTEGMIHLAQYPIIQYYKMIPLAHEIFFMFITLMDLPMFLNEKKAKKYKKKGRGF